MATRFLKIQSNGNKILKSKLMTAPSYMIIFNFSFPFSIESSGTKHTPNWFVRKDDKTNTQWTFKSDKNNQNNYWNQRNEAKFDPDMIDLWPAAT